MGYVLRVRFASFFVGVATASAAGLYVLHRDYKAAHETISHQVESVYETLDRRISALEKLKAAKAPAPALQHVEASE
ncbi:hypothetical protein GIB67_000951 [Kingdonia uniflora]|uniref:Uncharacterized protein n=1 Tax=Kingdonia uniflora TaxID=39325 RepID=A0A7J7MG65_9MAGN|nr:hypothetical protein GIB67_000951 [Kingdonia uniflora]